MESIIKLPTWKLFQGLVSWVTLGKLFTLENLHFLICKMWTLETTSQGYYEEQVK